MTEQEIRAAIARAQAGESQAEAALLEAHGGLIGNAIKALRGQSSLPYEDRRQAGYLGLLRAVRTFDLTRTTTFSSYAITCCRNAILDAIGQHREMPPLRRDLPCSEPPDQSLLTSCLSVLDPLELRAVELHYGLNDNLRHCKRATARVLGYSCEITSRILADALEKMQSAASVDCNGGISARSQHASSVN